MTATTDPITKRALEIRCAKGCTWEWALIQARLDAQHATSTKR